ncbi:unnamed protein product [Penicillium salamii]|uniref:Uncharacterized protein n=1 Tax=Penicillium salamii TaxID=1612424 RepID=A0A9W4JDP3_9EURO|nr:unnamed protein product [Penicillium salamii]
MLAQNRNRCRPVKNQQVRLRYSQKRPGRPNENQLANSELCPKTSLKTGMPSAIIHDKIQKTAQIAAHTARARMKSLCIELVPRNIRTYMNLTATWALTTPPITIC